MPLRRSILRPRFNPKMLPGLQLWLDAADSSYNASTGTWGDKSGNGRNFSQATANNRPIISATTQNGKPLLEFDGTNDQLIHSSNFLQASNCTMFSAFRRLGGTYGGVISSSSNADSSPGIIIDANQGAIRGFSNFSLAGSGVVDSFCIVSGQVNTGAATMWVDGTLRDTDAASGSLDTSQSQTAIGTYRTSAANYLQGYIGEIIVYATVLADAERKRVEAYLGTKWGITVA